MMITAISADCHEVIVNLGYRNVTRYNISELMTSIKKPRVTAITGKVNTTIKGRSTTFTILKIRAAHINTRNRPL